MLCPACLFYHALDGHFQRGGKPGTAAVLRVKKVLCATRMTLWVAKAGSGTSQARLVL
jgi:hypothetical protein